MRALIVTKETLPERHQSEAGRTTSRKPVGAPRTKSYAVVVILVTAVLLTLSERRADALIPGNVYPSGAQISSHPALSNQEMDCLWGFVCDGNHPNFHFLTEDQLHRLSGWAQFAGVHHNGRMTMAFEVFVSRYEPAPDTTSVPWSRYAFRDLKAALRAKRFNVAKSRVDLLSKTREGGSLVQVQRLGTQSLVVMALWTGALEIEGIAAYDNRPSSMKQTAWTSLERQIRSAVSIGA